MQTHKIGDLLYSRFFGIGIIIDILDNNLFPYVVEWPNARNINIRAVQYEYNFIAKSKDLLKTLAFVDSPDHFSQVRSGEIKYGQNL
jgi:hypothetical protein